MEFSVNNESFQSVTIDTDHSIICIDNIDIDHNGYGRITFEYDDGTNTLEFHGNGGLVFTYNGKKTLSMGKGVWNLQNILQFPKFMTAFCSSIYMKNTWEFCTKGLRKVDFTTVTTWSGMNNVKVKSSSEIPLYLRGTLITSMQESNEKYILSTCDMNEAKYLKRRLYNFSSHNRVLVDIVSYPGCDNKVFKCNSDVSFLPNSFVDSDNLLCCRSVSDISVINSKLGTRLLY